MHCVVYVCFADFSHTPPPPFSVMSQFVSDTLAGCVAVENARLSHHSTQPQDIERDEHK